MYTPDKGFMKKLRGMDKYLDVRWDGVRERWTIWRIVPSLGGSYKRNHLICYVQNDIGGYRPLDDRTIRMLKMADMQVRGADTVLDEIEESNAKLARDKAKKFHDDNEATAREIAPTVRKEMQSDVGAHNLPAEDYDAQLSSVLQRRGMSMEEVLS